MDPFHYNYRYCPLRELARVHGISKRKIEEWISELADEGKTLPGRLKFPGVKSYLYDPIIFHDEFFINKLNGPKKQDHLVIINNQQHKKVSI